MKSPRSVPMLAQMCLLSEPSPPSPGSPGRWEVLELPPAPTALNQQEDHGLRTSPATVSAACVVEPIQKPNHQPRLLLLSSPELQLRVNERGAAPVTVLREKDRLVWNDVTYHVAIRHRPRIGPPPPEKVGAECPVCRVPFTPDSRTYTCACGTTFHHEADAEDGLQCALALTNCPVCHRPIQLTDGFGHLPEEYHE